MDAPHPPADAAGARTAMGRERASFLVQFFQSGLSYTPAETGLRLIASGTEGCP